MLVNLTDSTIKQHLAKWQHDNKPYELRDTSIRGLCLRVGSISRKWCIHVVIHKKAHRVGLGSWPCITTEEARRRALDWLYRHREGWNDGRLTRATEAAPATVTSPVPALTHTEPAVTALPAGKASPTLAEVLALYLKHKRLKPNTERSYSDALKFHLKDLAGVAVVSLTSGHVLRLYQQLTDKLKPATANLQIRVLRALHRFWHALNEQTAPDIFKPLSTLGTRQKSGVRTRYLSEAQLKTLGEHWHKLTEQEQAFMLLGLCTGFRLSELKALSPSSYDAANHTLNLTQTKNGKSHCLPVPTQLQTVINKLCDSGKDKLLSGHLHNYASIISRKIGIDFSCHDLRRTFATHAIRLGTPAYTVKALLNHTDSSDITATHYVHLHTDDLRAPIKKIADHFLTILHAC